MPDAMRRCQFFPLPGQMAKNLRPFRKGQGINCVDNLGRAHWGRLRFKTKNGNFALLGISLLGETEIVEAIGTVSKGCFWCSYPS